MTLEAVGEWFWSDTFWLPPNVTWEDMGSQKQVNYASFADLGYPIPLGLLIILIRSLVENRIFRPLGLKLGIKNVTRRHPEAIPELEAAFKVQVKNSTSKKISNFQKNEHILQY
jgi:hypothetical protein